MQSLPVLVMEFLDSLKNYEISVGGEMRLSEWENREGKCVVWLQFACLEANRPMIVCLA